MADRSEPGPSGGAFTTASESASRFIDAPLVPEAREEPPINLFRFLATGPDAPPITDAERVDRLYRRCRLSILCAVVGGYGCLYTCRLALSVVKKPLIDNGIFTANDLGRIGSAIFYGYAFGRLVNGFLADHADLRKFFALGFVLSATANLVMGNTTLFWAWFVLWGLNGWSQGFGAPASIVSLARWFSNNERGRYYGIFSASHSIGEGLTFVGTSALVSWWGWRAGFLGPAIFCLLVAFVVYRLMKDRPETLGLPTVANWRNDHPAPAAGRDATAEPAGNVQLAVLKNPALWVICLASGTMYMTRYAINNWGMLYLQEARGYSTIQAGSILGLNTAAGIGGCIAYGFLSDLLFRARRPPVTLLYGLLEVAALFVIFLTPPGHPLILTAAFTVYGFTLSGLLAVLGGLFAVDIVPKKAAGAAIGLTGVVSYLSVAIQERISGYLIHHGTSIAEVSRLNEEGVAALVKVRHYDFTAPIIFWIGASILSLFLASSLWKVRARD